MGKIRLVALDLDGTLLTDDLIIEPRAKEILQQLIKQGIGVTLATGRMFSSAQLFAIELGLELPLIVYHGAQIRHAATAEVLYQSTLSLPLARRLIKHLRRFDFAYNVYLSDRLYVEKIHPENEEYAERTGIELHQVEDMLSFLQEDPIKIVALRDSHELDRLEQIIRQDVGKELYLTRSLPFYLEMLNPDVNKARALQELASWYDIAPAEIMVFGDSYNDVQMLAYACLGVAMGNAPDDVQTVADYVTASNNEGGVAQALEKFLL
mgnify:CR=1 FL=1